MLPSDKEIEAELSYAYVHAVASRAGFACEIAGRHSDRAGIDARIHVKERLAPHAIFTEFTLEVQLKATCQKAVLKDDYYSFWLTFDHYDKLRDTGVMNTRLLVVLFLPEDSSQWLSHTEDGLISKRCAYWVCLKGALPSENETGQTVYIPKPNWFSHESLRRLATKVACREALEYVLP
jgi:Domain of unknown function (DUF4365)